MLKVGPDQWDSARRSGSYSPIDSEISTGHNRHGGGGALGVTIPCW